MSKDLTIVQNEPVIIRKSTPSREDEKLRPEQLSGNGREGIESGKNDVDFLKPFMNFN